MDPRLAVLPPVSDVTERARVELRLAVPNPGSSPRAVAVDFFLDRERAAARLGGETLTVPPGGCAQARIRWPAAGHAGARRLLWRAQSNEGTHRGSWSVTVHPSSTPTLPAFQGAWIEPGAIMRNGDAKAAERSLREGVDAMAALGMQVLIVAYVEANGIFYYPTDLEFFDRDRQQVTRGAGCPFDVVGTLLSQAQKNGQQVLLGIGRGGDLWLLWQFEKADWAARNAFGIDLGKRTIADLWKRYGHYRSLYGWYFTHEMNDLAKASAYYDPLAQYCRTLAPEKPTLIAPAGTPIATPETVAASQVDIIAYQDAVGSGYVPYKNTFRPENRIAMLEEIYAKYRRWHAGSEKHLWADLEVWEMDGKHGYSHPYPPTFARVKRQIEVEAKHVDLLTAYAWFGYLHDPKGKTPAPDARAEALHRDYAAYLDAALPWLRRRPLRAGSPGRSGRR